LIPLARDPASGALAALGHIADPLAVAEIRNSQVVVIDPAPRSFGGAGF
jgi:hypothetical protein